MKLAYCGGIFAGMLAVFFLFVGFRSHQATLSQPESPAIAFEPVFTAASERWIVPGVPLKFRTHLTNFGRNAVRIEELRFSCPCASGMIAESARLPVEIPGGRSVPVDIIVTSQQKESGPVELKFGVIGTSGDRQIETGASASVRFVRHLNCEPPLVAIGTIKRQDRKHSAVVTLWYPADGEEPSSELSVTSDDPCVLVNVDRMAEPELIADGMNRKAVFSRILITVDPTIAPERMKAEVLVRSGRNELRIPVVGFVE